MIGERTEVSLSHLLLITPYHNTTTPAARHNTHIALHHQIESPPIHNQRSLYLTMTIDSNRSCTRKLRSLLSRYAPSGRFGTSRASNPTLSSPDFQHEISHRELTQQATRLDPPRDRPAQYDPARDHPIRGRRVRAPILHRSRAHHHHSAARKIRLQRQSLQPTTPLQKVPKRQRS
jgi:hypothetical protein